MNDYRIGGTIGDFIGVVTGTYGAINLGYELGSIVNDYFEISNTFIDPIVIVALIDPLFWLGGYCGRKIGIASEAALNKVVNGIRDLSDLVYNKEKI